MFENIYATNGGGSKTQIRIILYCLADMSYIFAWIHPILYGPIIDVFLFYQLRCVMLECVDVDFCFSNYVYVYLNSNYNIIKYRLLNFLIMKIILFHIKCLGEW